MPIAGLHDHHRQRWVRGAGDGAMGRFALSGHPRRTHTQWGRRGCHPGPMLVVGSPPSVAVGLA